MRRWLAVVLLVAACGDGVAVADARDACEQWWDVSILAYQQDVPDSRVFPRLRAIAAAVEPHDAALARDIRAVTRVETADEAARATVTVLGRCRDLGWPVPSQEEVERLIEG